MRIPVPPSVPRIQCFPSADFIRVTSVETRLVKDLQPEELERVWWIRLAACNRPAIYRGKAAVCRAISIYLYEECCTLSMKCLKAAGGGSSRHSSDI